MKKLIFTVLTLVFILTPSVAKANDEEIICPQPYGAGVVCGIKTHKTVNTGLGENLGVIGAGLLMSSLVFLVLSKKFQKISG